MKSANQNSDEFEYINATTMPSWSETRTLRYVLMIIMAMIGFPVALVLIVINAPPPQPVRYFQDQNTGLCYARYERALTLVPCDEKVLQIITGAPK